MSGLVVLSTIQLTGYKSLSIRIVAEEQYIRGFLLSITATPSGISHVFGAKLTRKDGSISEMSCASSLANDFSTTLRYRFRFLALPYVCLSLMLCILFGVPCMYPVQSCVKTCSESTYQDQ